MKAEVENLGIIRFVSPAILRSSILAKESKTMTEMNAKQQALLEARYGAAQQKPDNIIWTPQVEALLSHKSVRTFLPEALPDGAIETMVAAAQSASNSSALNQWSLVAVTDPALKQQISEIVARSVPVDRIPWIEEAPALLLWVADLSRGARITQDAGKEAVVLDYLDVMRNIAKQLAAIINLPEYSFVTFGMAVGLPDGARTSSVRPRPAQPMVLHYNQYEQGHYRKYLESYETAYQAFRRRQNMSDKTWTGSVIESATSMDYLGGRKALRETVIQRGFKLK